ncbi:MAG: twin-arginine translocation signal domain-containing protein [Geodermatophilaceae bacterium]
MSTFDLARISRRDFLRGAAVVAGAATAGPWLFPPAAGAEPLAVAAAAVDDRWLGPDFWANRLQDWVTRKGKITCVAAAGQRLARTASVLTRSLNGGAFRLQVGMGTSIQGTGFSGFLIGTGEPGTDYRRAALVGPASGEAGGLLCVYGTDGRVVFREHTNDVRQFDYTEIPSTASGPAPPRTKSEQVELTLDGVRQIDGTLTLTLTAVDARTGAVLSQAVLGGRTSASVAGGFAFVSCGPTGTHWFRNLRSSGAGVDSRPERGLGPIVGTLFSLANGVLKMTAQVMPMLLQPGDQVRLEISDGAGGWITRASAPIGPGFAAALRDDAWDATVAHPYRVVHSRGGTYEGTVPAEPGADGMTVLTLSCTKATHRAVDKGTRYEPRVAGEKALGMYTSRNVYFPFEQLAQGMQAQQPDIVFAMGDQFYEHSPTKADQSTAPELDFLYKYLLWLWSFRDITRNTPCMVLIDDHDVFQSNLYGEGGRPLLVEGDLSTGGYRNDPAWVNIVQRVQCGHNPDPVDPAPAQQGITVYFTRFTYGGVRFALLEDRKFKSGGDALDDQGNPVPEEALQLLGPRQEAMLAGLAAEGAGPPTVVVSQTMYACLQTSSTGRTQERPGSGRVAEAGSGPGVDVDGRRRRRGAVGGHPPAGPRPTTSTDRCSSAGRRAAPPSFAGSSPGIHCKIRGPSPTPGISSTASATRCTVVRGPKRPRTDSRSGSTRTTTTTSGTGTSRRRGTACCASTR